MEGDIAEVLISEKQIHARVAELACAIEKNCHDTEGGLVIVTVLSGAMIFLADLIRELPIKLEIGLVTVSSYPGRNTTSQGARMETMKVPRLGGRNVLIVDDILDSGGTLRLVQREVARQEPRMVRTVVLLRKPGKAPADVNVDFVGFDVADRFVVGYGLDYDGLYRNLPYIGTLAPHCLPPGVG